MIKLQDSASSVTVVVKELAKANASNWLWQIRVALGRSDSFKLQQSTRLQGSQRLSMERGQFSEGGLAHSIQLPSPTNVCFALRWYRLL